MINALKFVKGAVAKKAIIPALTHFRIYEGRVKGHNGIMTIASPIDIGIDCQPKAVDFIKAIELCEGTVHLSMTPAGRLTVKSGKFKSHINCVEEDFPDVEPEGEMHYLPGKLLRALKTLEPLIAEDASRPWARSILFRGEFAFATNNVVICQYWLEYNFPFDLGIPHGAVNELLRIGIEPVGMQITETSVTFHYPEGRWFRTQTASTAWPDVDRILNKEDVEANDLPLDFFDNLELLKPFKDERNRIFFIQNAMATSAEEGVGARVEHSPEFVNTFPVDVVFNLEMLRMLKGIATSFDFNHSPALFFGENLRGAIVPMRSL